jgi:hypothetical protein
MLREEAEREAERRNHEEPDRARYEFYAFDESAGMAEDAWDVAARLREGPSPRAEWPGLGPQTPAGGAPPPVPPKPTEPVEEPLVLEGPTIAETDPFAGPDPFVEPLPYEAPLPYEEPPPPGEPGEDGGRAGVFVRVLGAVVIVVGMLWMAMIVVLAVVLKPNEVTTFVALLFASALGLLAILLGAVIRRS